MLIELEGLTGRTIPSSILLEASTIRQLALRLSEEDGLQTKPLTKLNANGRHTPLFFFHGDYIGGGAYVRKLASLLGSDQPLFVIAPHSVDTPISRSIEAMAADRLPLIRSAQPQGPYRLAGYCTAGLVAFEVARLLAAAGEKVEMVAMIDSPTINARQSIQTLLSIFARARPITGTVVQRAMARTWRKLKRLENLSNLPLSKQWAWAKDKARALVVAARNRALTTLRAGGRNSMDQATEPIRQTIFGRITRANTALVENALRLANSNYFPAPLAVRVVYFSPSYNGNYFPNNGKTWLRISSDLEVINLPSDHDSMITDPTDLAHHLRTQLQRENRQTCAPTKSGAS
jgi:thioesterase domain-containing protein